MTTTISPDAARNTAEQDPGRHAAATTTAAGATTPDATAPDDAMRVEGDDDPTITVRTLHGDAPVTATAPTFAELGVDGRIVSALADAGIVRAFAIQELTLPIALDGHDLIGQARTGMGKTLGFGVPLLQRLAEQSADASPEGALPGGRAPRALVMVPTRELCVQVSRDIAGAAKNLRLKVAAVYGGRAYEPQIAALQAGVDVIVGTPGRLLDLANSGHLVLGTIRVLVLDEADEMLDLGFLPDIERVLAMVPAQRQTMLFSATMPGPIITLARTFMVQPTHIRAELPADSVIHKTTTQFVYRAHALDKVEMLSRILQARGRGLSMVFTRTKRTAAKVADELTDRGFAAAAVHGDLGQGAREQALRAFRSGKVDVLVATDVAARGIDVEGVTHVVNYQCPDDEKTYIHRIGRTGRAGHSGVAITFVDWDDVPRWKLINDTLGLDHAEPVETYSSSAHLRTDLGIAEDVTGRLPRDKRTRAGLAAEKVEDIGETGRHGSGDRGGHAGNEHGDRGDRGRRSGRGGRSGRGRGRERSREQAAAPRTSGHGGTSRQDRAAESTASATAEAGAPKAGATAARRSRRRRTRGGSPSGAATSGVTAPATQG